MQKSFDSSIIAQIASALPELKLPAGLYVVATPIGNLADITLRALHVLKNADLIAAEDTRHSGQLLAAYGIKKDLISYHDHNEERRAEMLARKIADGKSVALISDAGTPLLSDPGFDLIRACQELGVRVIPVPGASSVTAALSASGIAPLPFAFLGFLPAKGARQKLIDFKDTPASLVLFESAQKLDGALELCIEILGDRNAAAARELTKKFEEIRRGSLSELRAHYAANPPRGEITLVIAPPEKGAMDEENLQPLLQSLLQDRSLKDAVEQAAEITALPRGIVYKTALELKHKI